MLIKISWRYWRTPALFGSGFCIVQILTAIVRFGGLGWDPAILFGFAIFFLCGLLIGLLVQRLLKGLTRSLAHHLDGLRCAGESVFAVLFSLVGGLLGPPGVLRGERVSF